MNKRIKELAVEAGFMDFWFSESGDDCERELKKFAELIVRDCALTAELMEPYDRTGIAAQILDNFGIEEPNNSLNFELSEGV